MSIEYRLEKNPRALRNFIDTSIIVNSFLIEEKGSENSGSLLEKIKEGEMIGITSELILVDSTKYGLRACGSLQVASSLLENVTNFVQKDKNFERISKVINLLDPKDLVSK